MKLLAAIWNDLATRVRAVNEKYREPRIPMTPMVRMSLIGLRVYLFTLVGLMLFKFVMLAR